MKTTSLQAVAQKYNLTLLRACDEILAAAGVEPRKYRAVIRRQNIPENLIEVARAYQARKKNQLRAGELIGLAK